MDFRIENGQNLKIFLADTENEAVRIAAGNLVKDLQECLEISAELTNDISESKIIIKTEPGAEFVAGALIHKEQYAHSVKDGKLYISGYDRRGSIYGIYELSRLIGVSAWHYFADVPCKKRDEFSLTEGYFFTDFPSVEYRGVFINDEEELDNWAKLHMKEETIGLKTYEKVFELLLRMKANYIWPAMHVNSFNVNPENGALANRMGIVVGTSHCDMLMRSNNREWYPWLAKKGYTDVAYDYSIPGRNREILDEYWRESVQQNKDFEVSYTLGMRGIHDSGFETKSLEGLSGEELLKAKIDLLKTVISSQEKILDEELEEKPLKIFVPYKEVLPLYDNGLEVPEDLTLIWANDNYGHIRRFPGEREKGRTAGNGLYYHNSYWAGAGASYLFINSIPLAHTRNELRKAYQEDIRKVWVLNVGAIKPLEMEIAFYLDYAWNAGKENALTDNVDIWLARWIDSQFSGNVGNEMAELLNDFAQLANVRKIEFMESDAFSQTAYGDEAAYRLAEFKDIYTRANDIYYTLKNTEKDAFFQMFLMKIHAAYITYLMYYYADRSNICNKRGAYRDADRYCDLSTHYDELRRRLIRYYNEIMSGGKWEKIVTPEDFPPPRTAMYPAAVPALVSEKSRAIVSIYNGDDELNFVRKNTKWMEISASGENELTYSIMYPAWLELSSCEGVLSKETRIFVKPLSLSTASGEIIISFSDGTRTVIPVKYTSLNEFGTIATEDDGIVAIDANKYVECEGFKAIARLGRNHGALLEAQGGNNLVSYTFSIKTEGEHTLEIHRFPSLDSTGNIGVIVSVDEGEAIFCQTEANDEHRGSWSVNVKTGVDKIYVKLPYLKAGNHTLKLCGATKYFAISRMAIYTKPEKTNSLGLLIDVPVAIPEEIDEFDAYKHLPIKRRDMLVMPIPNEHVDNNTLPDILIKIKDEGNPRKIKPSDYLMMADRVFIEQGNEIKIDAAAALSRAEEVWEYCRSESYGKTGIAMHIRQRGIKFTEDLPALNYKLHTVGGKYTIWVLIKSDAQEDASFGLAIDNQIIDDSLLYGGKRIGRYCLEQVYAWIPIYVTELSEGDHELSILAKYSNTRFDRIYISADGKLPPVDSAWVR